MMQGQTTVDHHPTGVEEEVVEAEIDLLEVNQRVTECDYLRGCV